MSNKPKGNRGSRFSQQSLPPGRRQRIFASIGATTNSSFTKPAAAKKTNSSKPNAAGTQPLPQTGIEE